MSDLELPTEAASNALTVEAIRTVSFERADRGYDRESVHEFLSAVGDLVASYEQAHLDLRTAATVLGDAEAQASQLLETARAECEQLRQDAARELSAHRAQLQVERAAVEQARREAEEVLDEARARDEASAEDRARAKAASDAQISQDRAAAQRELTQLMELAARHRADLASLEQSRDDARASVRALADRLLGVSVGDAPSPALPSEPASAALPPATSPTSSPVDLGGAFGPSFGATGGPSEADGYGYGES